MIQVTSELKHYVETRIIPLYDDSPNARRLQALQVLMDDESELRNYFDRHFVAQD